MYERRCVRSDGRQEAGLWVMLRPEMAEVRHSNSGKARAGLHRTRVAAGRPASHAVPTRHRAAWIDPLKDPESATKRTCWAIIRLKDCVRGWCQQRRAYMPNRT